MYGVITQRADKHRKVRQIKEITRQYTKQEHTASTMNTFTHQTPAEIMATRHVQAIEDLEEITSSRECYLQIRSMIIVAEEEKKENNSIDKDSIRHLHNESSRMETR